MKIDGNFANDICDPILKRRTSYLLIEAVFQTGYFVNTFTDANYIPRVNHRLRMYPIILERA